MLNDDGLTVRVLAVDSRTRTSGTASDCEISLPEAINLPSGAVAWCTSVNVPLAWTNVSTLNNKLYVTEYSHEVGLPSPFVSAAGPWSLSGTSYLWVPTGNAHEFQYLDAGSSSPSVPRTILFTEWSHGSDTIKFTETRPGTTINYVYDKTNNVFNGGDGSTWSPPGSFHVRGAFPSTAPANTTSQSYVVDVTPGEYNRTGVVAAVQDALNNKTGSILPLPVTYSGTLSTHEMSLGLLYDGAAQRYDYQGIWTSGANSRQVVRDWRHLRVQTMFPEYVMTPDYDFEGIGFTLVDSYGDTHTGTVTAGNPAFPAGTLTYTETNGTVVVLRLKLHTDFHQYGGHPAFFASLIATEPGQPPSTYTDDFSYDAEHRRMNFTGAIALTITFASDPVINSLEVISTSPGTGLSWNAAGLTVKKILHLPDVQVTVSSSANQHSITFPFSTPVTFSANYLPEMLPLHYAFELTPELLLRPGNRNTQSINQRIGHMNLGASDRTGQKNAAHDLGLFKSTINVPQLGEAIFLCSSLTAHAGMLPNGSLGSIAVIPLLNHTHKDTIYVREPAERNQVDVGGRVLSNLRFTLRDHSGNLIPLEEGYEWSATIQFGFPTN